ncbi:MAG: hypothetical protein SOW40_07535 [Campylobacter hominis]|nr:hypothetical protein [Campylobacter sp.]MDD7422171.1 hypothetical protein [Campylobacter hominis]MDY3117832.1 hypothetical protein [Campylobacter hominis]
MKKERKCNLFDTPLKQFIWIFTSIHIIGIAINAILYFLKIPSGIEKLLNGNPFFIILAIISYVVFNAMLYVIIKIRFIISEK